jgi:MFS family permease
VLLVGAAACFFLIQNWPRDAVRTEKQTQSGGISVRVTWMFAAVVAIGVLGNTGFQYLTMHFTARDFTPYQVSVLVSVLGTALMASKFLFGEAVDRWGAYRSNWMFFGSTILGCVLCCVAGGYGLAMGAVLLYGLGLAFGTVGLTVYAKDLSSPEEFADIVRQNEIAYLLGALLFGSVPGLLADWTGSYTAFYGLLTALAVFAMVVVQRSYHKKSTSI